MVVPDEPKEKLLPGAESICVASRAACTAASAVREEPLYQHIATLRFGEVGQFNLSSITFLHENNSIFGNLCFFLRYWYIHICMSFLDLLHFDRYELKIIVKF